MVKQINGDGENTVLGTGCRLIMSTSVLCEVLELHSGKHLLRRDPCMKKPVPQSFRYGNSESLGSSFQGHLPRTSRNRIKKERKELWSQLAIFRDASEYKPWKSNGWRSAGFYNLWWHHWPGNNENLLNLCCAWQDSRWAGARDDGRCCPFRILRTNQIPFNS